MSASLAKKKNPDLDSRGKSLQTESAVLRPTTEHGDRRGVVSDAKGIKRTRTRRSASRKRNGRCQVYNRQSQVLGVLTETSYADAVRKLGPDKCIRN